MHLNKAIQSLQQESARSIDLNGENNGGADPFTLNRKILNAAFSADVLGQNNPNGLRQEKKLLYFQ